MKRHLLLTALAASSLVVFGQNQLDKRTGVEAPLKPQTLELPEVPFNKAKEDFTVTPKSTNNVVIWSQDFANGIPATWTNSGSPAAALWEYRGPNTTPNNTVGSRGAFGSAQPVNSATAANGFIIFDSDFLDNGGNNTQMGNGPAPAPHTGSLTTGVINLAGHPQIKLEWTEYYRSLNLRMLVLASTDGGATFPDTVWNRNFNRYTTNQASALNNAVSIDVSSQLGNQANVRLRFIAAPDQNPGVQAGLNNYYTWMLDDIKIVQKPANDLALEDFSFDQVGKDFVYGHMPAAHTAPYNFTTAGRNIGSMPQTNTRGVATITVGTSPFALLNTPSVVLAPGARDTAVTPNFTPTPRLVQTYGVELRMASDSVTTTSPFNGFTSTIRTTDSIMSLDFNGGRVATLGSRSFTGVTDGLMITNHIELGTADTLNGISFVLSAAANSRSAGAGVVISVFDTTNFSTWFTQDMATAGPTLKMQSDFYTLTVADSASRNVYVPIPAVLNGVPQDRRLAAGGYMVSVELFSNNNANGIAILDDITVTQTPWASLIYFPGNASNGARWFSNGNAFFVRAHLNKPFGVNASAMKAIDNKVTVFPNPANRVAYVRYATEQNANVNIIVRDITGKIVHQVNQGNQLAGEHQVELNTSNFANGIYLYEVNVNGNRTAGKLMVANN